MNKVWKLSSRVLVAFGTVAQLVLISTSTETLDKYIAFMLSVDLPVTFALLGIPDVTDDEIREVARRSCAPGETIWNMERVVTEDAVFSAIKGADAAGKDFIARTGWKKV